MTTPTIGTRLNLSGHLGTIKYIGEVYNTQGNWLGVEWDDPKRGKHDGVNGGVRDFNFRLGILLTPQLYALILILSLLLSLACRMQDRSSALPPRFNTANLSYKRCDLNILKRGTAGLRKKPFF